MAGKPNMHRFTWKGKSYYTNETAAGKIVGRSPWYLRDKMVEAHSEGIPIDERMQYAVDQIGKPTRQKEKMKKSVSPKADKYKLTHEERYREKHLDTINGWLYAQRPPEIG